jgi:hypothetical protein
MSATEAGARQLCIAASDGSHHKRKLRLTPLTLHLRLSFLQNTCNNHAQGLYTVDFSGGAPIITAADAVQPDGATPKQYNDIKWASKTGRLYASAGECVAIDVLEIQG